MLIPLFRILMEMKIDDKHTGKTGSGFCSNCTDLFNSGACCHIWRVQLVVAEIAASADSNNARVVSVREIRDLLNLQQVLVSESMANLNLSAAKEFDENNEMIIEAIESLSQQSEENEKAALNQLKENNSQFAGLFKGKISDSIKKTDRSEYDAMLTTLEGQYGSLLKKSRN